MNKMIFQIILLAATLLPSPLAGIARSEATGLTGWEKDSAYNRLYNYNERDSIKGKVLKFKEVVPMPGMAPGTALVFDEEGQEILVHVCPLAFANAQKTGIRKDIKTKIAGSWATINGQDVFMAAKIKQGDNFEYKVRRTKDGTPLWTMTPEEAAKESVTP
jgi:hypothetical protein